MPSVGGAPKSGDAPAPTSPQRRRSSVAAHPLSPHAIAIAAQQSELVAMQAQLRSQQEQLQVQQAEAKRLADDAKKAAFVAALSPRQHIKLWVRGYEVPEPNLADSDVSVLSSVVGVGMLSPSK